MARLSIRLFGSFEVTLEGEPVTGFASDKVRALLAYLVAESDCPHRREALAGLLWPEYPESSARASLRRALANLRMVIGDRQASPPFLSISRQTVQFNCVKDAWCDVTAFTHSLEAAQSSQAIDPLEEAAELYRGSFLEGFSLGDSVAFEEWLLLQRERLRREALAALRRLATHHEAQGEYGKALPYARQQVDLEPWQEEAQRQLMRLLTLNGQRGLAVAQYEACRRTLADQLSVEPADETTWLYEQIRDGAASFGQVKEQEIAHDLPKTPTMSLPSTQRHLPDWHKISVRLALIGGSLLLLAVAIMQGLVFFGVAPPERVAPPPENLMVSPVGKVVLPCQDTAPPQICVHEFRSGKLTQVTDNLEFEEMDAITWAPDGRQIVFDAGPVFGSVRPCNHHLYIINTDGSNLRQLTSGDTCDQIPNWSPDGEWIAFNRSQELWLIHPDGSEPHRLVGELAQFCVGELKWSPNSRQLAFIGGECTPVPLPLNEVWVINHDGTAAQMVHTFEQQPDDATLHWDQNGLAIICEHTYVDGVPRFLHIDSKGIGEPFLIDVLPFEWRPNYWPQWGKAE
jgi:DNA-binding SARP family transcriptional activator